MPETGDLVRHEREPRPSAADAWGRCCWREFPPPAVTVVLIHRPCQSGKATLARLVGERCGDGEVSSDEAAGRAARRHGRSR
jgi:hypothetical protein